MRIPRPILSVHGEDVDLEVPGLLTIRTTFLSEGLFDELSGGDPEEEDLYEVEVSHPGDALLEPITFPRLMPASRPSWEEEIPDLDVEDEAASVLPMERFAMALAWELANADPSNWTVVCQAARGWDSWMVEDALSRLPTEWTPEPLVPDDL
jgi:hypothetical protein